MRLTSSQRTLPGGLALLNKIYDQWLWVTQFEIGPYILLILQYSPMTKFFPLSRRTEHNRFLGTYLSIEPVLQTIKCSEAKPRLKLVSSGMNMEGLLTLSSALRCPLS